MGGASYPKLPGWVVAALVLGIGLTGGDYALAKLIGPYIVKDVAMGQMHTSLSVLALIAFGVVGVVAFVSGLLGARTGIKRGGEQRWANLVGVLFGCALLPGGLLAYALIEKIPWQQRPTEINLALIAIGAVLGWVVGELRRGAINKKKTGMSGRAVLGVALTLVLTGAGWAPGTEPIPAGAIKAADFGKGDCNLIAIEETGQLEVALFSVTLGASYGYKETGKADGTWEAEVTEGVQGGLTLGLGSHVGAQFLGGTPLKEGLSFSMKALGDLERVNTYDIEQKTVADKAVKVELLNFLNKNVMLPGESQLSASDGTSNVLGQYQAQYPTKTDLSLNGKLTFSVEAGALINYSVDVSMGAGAGVTLMTDKAHPNTDHDLVANPTTIDLYLNLSGEGSGQISTLLAAFGGNAAGSAVLTMEMAPQTSAQVWLPSSVAVSATVEGGVDLGNNFSGDQWSKTLSPEAADKVSKWFKALGLKSSQTVGVKVTMTQTLKFINKPGETGPVHPEDSTLFEDYFAAYQKAVGQNATKADRQNLQAAAQKFGAAFQRDAEETFAIYVTNKTEQGVSFQMGEIFVNGASVGQDSATERLKLAFYRSEAGQWLVSSSCVEGNPPAVKLGP